MENVTITPIAHIRSDFSGKFGIPRQSGIVPQLRAEIVFEPEYRVADALRGLEGFSHLWLIWQFSQAVRPGWSATVRPPRLGGNTRMGVFATRSPFRPNHLGLSCVELLGMERREQEGTVLLVGGADLLDGTPIFDIKPYIAYSDSRPDALGGFTGGTEGTVLDVDFPEPLLTLLPPDKREAAIGILAHDPCPSYQNDPQRVYGFHFAGYELRFRVEENRLIVLEVQKL